MKTQDHVLKMNFPTTTLFMPGIPTISDRTTSLVTTEATAFELDITQTPKSPNTYPEDIHRWGQHLRELTSTPTYKNSNIGPISELFAQAFPANTQIREATFASLGEQSSIVADQSEKDVSSISQEDIKSIILAKILTTADDLSSITLYRSPPSTPDIVSLRTTKRMSTGDQYFISGKISTASESTLQNADQQLPLWVTDRYLQLPASIPDRIRLLAEELTVNKTNQYDKIVALQSFLRSYDYKLNRDKHPHQSDAVDHFLFTSKVGYCDDFASSLAIMSRTLGIPSRVMAGYGPGVWGSEGDYSIIRDEDSHVWVEVFFSGYGWITFEPTPKYPLPSRSSGQTPSDTFDSESNSASDSTDISGDEELFDQGNTALEGDFSGFRNEDTLGISFRAAALFSLVIVIIVITMLFGTWMRIMKSLGDPNRTYSLMCTLGRIAGVRLLPNMTPFEYANVLARTIPSAKRSIQTVASEYVLARYAKRPSNTSSTSLLDNALKQIQSAILTRLLRLGAPQDQQES